MINVEKARDELENILQGKEYTAYNASKVESWWEKAKDWIADQLAKLFPSFEAASAAAGPLLVIIIIAVLILIAVVVFLLVRYSGRRMKYREQSPFQSMREIDWSFPMHLEEAKRREELAEYSLAIRHLFLALLLYFHEKQWLIARVWKTNGEYYQELKKVNQKWANEFHDLALIFDEVTYGEKSVLEEEYIQFRIKAMKWLEEA
ncbi:DUF4129 domain-containing protein [Bacillus sp. FJAT-50079]|uniref:DUF4129 domain-containing protein n=1 Tax=Bacillus sp. FJAT-50079 TaxID=2833577 RepID=UPI001BC9E4F7|nr:DUF4129 domain-containing protein [Bacillus sp. FJAT-50079]MBS4208019.1 DUF4129 domain-containing protein [Bacillus sp. FJAT-50079]